MKKYFTALLALLLMAGGFSSSVYAEQKPRAAPEIKFLEDATVERLMKAEELSEQHHMLSSLSGTWHYTLQYWSNEGAEAQASTGLMTNELILGGRFLSSKTVLILNIGGQNIPYESASLLGYDPLKKAFTSVWADRGHVGMVTGSGKYNAETKIIEEKGRFTHPLIEKERAYRSVLQFTGESTHKRAVFMTDAAGKEFKVLEADFTRHP